MQSWWCRLIFLSCQYQEVVQKTLKTWSCQYIWPCQNTATVDSKGWWSLKWKDYLPTMSISHPHLFSHSATPAFFAPGWSQINLRYRGNMGSYWAKRDRKIQVSPQATNPATNWSLGPRIPATDSQLATLFLSDNDSSKIKTLCTWGMSNVRPNLLLIDGRWTLCPVKLGWTK